jgi:hypothetical protein
MKPQIDAPKLHGAIPKNELAPQDDKTFCRVFSS